MNGRYLPPRLLQVVGLILLVAFCVFWAFTGKQSALLVGASAGLIALGGYERVQRVLNVLAEEDHSDDSEPHGD